MIGEVNVNDVTVEFVFEFMLEDAMRLKIVSSDTKLKYQKSIWHLRKAEKITKNFESKMKSLRLIVIVVTREFILSS